MQAVLYRPVVQLGVGVEYYTDLIEMCKQECIARALSCMSFARIDDPCPGHIAVKNNDANIKTGMVACTKFTWSRLYVPGPILVMGFADGQLKPISIDPQRILNTIEHVRIYDQLIRRFDTQPVH